RSSDADVVLHATAHRGCAVSQSRMLLEEENSSLSAKMVRLTPRSAVFPYTTLFRSKLATQGDATKYSFPRPMTDRPGLDFSFSRSEEHTSELQSRENLVCRLLLEKKKDREDETHELTTEVGNVAAALWTGTTVCDAV